MGTRKQINLRISGSRVLGRLKKSCNCCVEIQIYTPSIYCPLHIRAKKLANSREKKKKEKKSLKKPSQDLTAARRILRTHSLILFKRKNIKPIRKILFPPPFVFCYYFSLTLFFLFLQSSHQT